MIQCNVQTFENLLNINRRTGEILMDDYSKEQIHADVYNEVQRQKHEIEKLKSAAKDIFIKDTFHITKNDLGEYTLTLCTDEPYSFYKIMELLNGQTPFNFNIDNDILNELTKRKR